MNCTLERNKFRPDGIFSTLFDEGGTQIAVALSHAYQNGEGLWYPKVPNGVWVCKRGLHRLHGMTESFETFEITGIEGHVNLLFHWGNYNADSEGCELLGSTVAPTTYKGEKCLMVTNSKATFAKFMQLQDGIDQFTLTVR